MAVLSKSVLFGCVGWWWYPPTLDNILSYGTPAISASLLHKYDFSILTWYRTNMVDYINDSDQATLTPESLWKFLCLRLDYLDLAGQKWSNHQLLYEWWVFYTRMRATAREIFVIHSHDVKTGQQVDRMFELMFICNCALLFGFN